MPESPDTMVVVFRSGKFSERNVVINSADFDPALHARPGEVSPPAAEPVVEAQTKRRGAGR